MSERVYKPMMKTEVFGIGLGPSCSLARSLASEIQITISLIVFDASFNQIKYQKLRK